MARGSSKARGKEVSQIKADGQVKGRPEMTAFIIVLVRSVRDSMDLEIIMKQFTITFNESELTLLITALERLTQRQRYLATLAHNNARDEEAQKRLESADAITALSDKLYRIAAQEGEQ
jgi:hypothetical protein